MRNLQTLSAFIENCPETGLYVGYVPGIPGAHSQGATLGELNANLREVAAMLLGDDVPTLEAGFIGSQTMIVA